MADLPGWSHYKVISITGQSGAGTDYQVELEVGDSAGGDVHLEGHCTNFPQDIRITDDDGTTLLDHWVEDLTADPIVMHVEVDDDLGSNQDIRIYYGKSGETTASNGVNTFELFDDFNRSDSPTVGNGWSETGNSQIKDNNVYAAGSSSSISKNFNFGSGLFGITARVKKSAFSRTFQINLHDGSYRSILSISESESPPRDDSIARYSGPIIIDPYVEDQYYILQHNRVGSNLYDMWADGISITNQASYGASSSNKIDIMLAYDGDSDGWVDWVFIRKYNSPEPAFSSAGSEQTPTPTAKPMWYYDMLRRRNQ